MYAGVSIRVHSWTFVAESLSCHLSLFSIPRCSKSSSGLTIHWQKSLPGLVGGHNTSRFAGPGQEFLDHRNFHHGDDLRAVNWRVFLRLEKLFLKMFQLEPRIPVRLLIDTSRSMLTGEKSKFDYARKLAGGVVLRRAGAPGFDLPAAVFRQAGRRIHRQRRTPSLSAGRQFSVGDSAAGENQFHGSGARVRFQLSSARAAAW